MQECYANRIFANKIWQAVKFASLQFAQFGDLLWQTEYDKLALSKIDLWILGKLAQFQNVTKTSFENYDFHLATKGFKKFFHHEFCDVYIVSLRTLFGNKVLAFVTKNHTHFQKSEISIIIIISKVSNGGWESAHLYLLIVSTILLKIW